MSSLSPPSESFPSTECGPPESLKVRFPVRPAGTYTVRSPVCVPSAAPPVRSDVALLGCTRVCWSPPPPRGTPSADFLSSLCPCSALGASALQAVGASALQAVGALSSPPLPWEWVGVTGVAGFRSLGRHGPLLPDVTES